MTSKLFALLCTLILSTSALAQHGGDVLLTVEGAGNDRRIVTNLTGSPIVPMRVFEAELGEDFPNWTNEPGFDTASPGPFAPGAGVGFNILDALRNWDPVSENFDTIAEETMTIAFASGIAGNLRTTPAEANQTVAGFTLAANSAGQWHRHLEFSLNAPAADGIYLLKLELFGTEPGLNASLPFYLVFNQNLDEQTHEAAASYVESSQVPEPAGIAAVLLVGVTLMRRRHRGR